MKRFLEKNVLMEQYNNQTIILCMAQIIQKAMKILFASFDQHALIQGASDIMVVKWESGHYHSTPFLICFGHATTTAIKNQVKVYVNDSIVSKAKFMLDQYGYVHPMKPSSEFISQLSLRYGRNTIKFEISPQEFIEAEIYLYDEHQKVLVSDVDGTLTKSDVRGLYNNLHGDNYLHDGYYQLLEKAHNKGCAIVWLTMRSMPLYKFSKDYISKHTRLHGVLLTEPEQFLPAMKKELMKQTGNIKTNMMKTIRDLFPQYCNPFIGGLGNRENDAIAYRAAGIALQNIFIIDTESKVHHLSNYEHYVTYKQMSENMENYFTLTKRKSMKKLMSLEQQAKEKNKQKALKHQNSNLV